MSSRGKVMRRGAYACDEVTRRIAPQLHELSITSEWAGEPADGIAGLRLW
jgi:hypothetical protein